MAKHEIDLTETAATIQAFSWWNYGLDAVGETESDDWAKALAAEVAPVVLDAERKRIESQPPQPFTARQLLGDDFATYLLEEFREALDTALLGLDACPREGQPMCAECITTATGIAAETLRELLATERV